MAFSYGVLFEYMMIDYLEIKLKVIRSNLVPCTIFEPQYQNCNKMPYNDFTFLLGSAIHFTFRKLWGLSLTPVEGYTRGEYSAAPVEDGLVYSFSAPASLDLVRIYGAKRKKKPDRVCLL